MAECFGLADLLARARQDAGELCWRKKSHPAFAIIGFGDRSIKNHLAGAPDVRSGAIALDERDIGLIRNQQFTVLHFNLFSIPRQGKK